MMELIDRFFRDVAKPRPIEDVKARMSYRFTNQLDNPPMIQGCDHETS